MARYPIERARARSSTGAAATSIWTARNGWLTLVAALITGSGLALAFLATFARRSRKKIGITRYGDLGCAFDFKEMKPDKSSILIAEDNLNDVFLLKSAFQEAAPKMRINVVGNGEELISYLSAIEAGGTPPPIPALILLDLKMPKVDGFEALEWIRHQPELKRLLVIVFSSSGESGQINRAYDLRSEFVFG